MTCLRCLTRHLKINIKPLILMKIQLIAKATIRKLETLKYVVKL